MRTWTLIAGVALVLSFACGDTAAKGVVQPPPELLVTISLGSDSALDSLRGFANTVRPGTGALLTQNIVRQKLAELGGADSVDGLDPMAPTYVLIVDGGAQLKGAVIVGKVRDEKVLVAGLGRAHSAIDHGWAAIGPEAIVRKVAAYALTSLPSQPAPSSPTAVVYVPQLLKRYRTEIALVRKQAASQLAATQGSTQMNTVMQSYVDGLFAAISDTDQVLVALDVATDVGAIDLAMVPRPGTRLAKFVAAQHASDYGLLAKLPAATAPVLIAGHLESGPYRQGMLDVFAAMYGQGANKELAATIGALMQASTGDLAMLMQMGAGKPMAFTQVFGLADKKTADRSIDHLLELFKPGITVTNMGIATTIKTNGTTIDRDGIALKGYDVTYDYSKAPAASRAMMEKMIPGGTTTARMATFDELAIVTLGGSDPLAALDAARGKGNHFTPNAATVEFLAGSRARKESFMMMMDFGAIAAVPGPARLIIMSAGFADKTAHLRITLPAATIRTLSGQP